MNLSITNFDSYQEKYQQSIKNPDQFWEVIASQFKWQKKWDKVCSWDFNQVDIKWFEGAKLNITENCLDRHLPQKANDIAIIWEPSEPGQPFIQLTYQQLYEQVCQTCSMLKELGIEKGDRVCLYMPMVPELLIAVLACARIGAVHTVVFGGFSANALAERIDDAGCKLLITTDGAKRGHKIIPFKQIVDEALALSKHIEKTLVYRHLGEKCAMQQGRDIWWHELSQNQPSEFIAVAMDAEDPLFILYTSGSTGKPKGVVHTCAGYMVWTAFTFQNVFQYKEGEVFWCSADIGWITGHSYLTYGPLLSGATTLMFEGIPTYPDASRFWQVIERHRVNIFYTAPTAIRSLMAHGTTLPEQFEMESLSVLGTVGEPINEEAWQWYFNYIGKRRCPIVDTWWQTETGGIMIAGLAGVTPQKPTFASYPLPGVQPILVNENGKEITEPSTNGYLCIKYPWPGMLRTTYGDHERCIQTYFSTFPGLYFTGDGAFRDELGMYRINGRVDDVINVSGHRFGTAEIENAINLHPNAIESAVVGYPHDIKGEGIYAYVIFEQNEINEEQLIHEIKDLVIKQIGKIAQPDYIQLVQGLPKTRSGKIMRRILRKIAAGQYDELGDTSTLLNPECIEFLKEGQKSLMTSS